jgi:hypothetical protein
LLHRGVERIQVGVEDRRFHFMTLATAWDKFGRAKVLTVSGTLVPRDGTNCPRSGTLGKR